MALHRRDLIASINSIASSVNSQFDSVIGLTTSSTDGAATATGSVDTTTSSGPSTTSATATSSVKPAASSTSKSADSAITSGSSVASTETISSSLTSSAGSISLSTSSRSTSTTSTTSVPANPVSLPTGTASSSASDNGNHVSTAGIAVAAVFGILIISSIAYLMWKYLPAARRYRERKYQERSHRTGLSLDDEEGMHFDDPKQGLGLRKFSFYSAPTYYPGQPQEPKDLSQRPLTSASEKHVVSPMSMRSMGSLSQHTLPSALQPAPHYLPYRDVRASQIGVAVPIRSPSPMDKGLPPLPSNGYVGPFP